MDLVDSISIIPIYEALFALLVRLFPSLMAIYAITKIPDLVIYTLDFFMPDTSELNNSSISPSSVKSSLGHRPFI